MAPWFDSNCRPLTLAASTVGQHHRPSCQNVVVDFRQRGPHQAARHQSVQVARTAYVRQQQGKRQNGKVKPDEILNPDEIRRLIDAAKPDLSAR